MAPGRVCSVFLELWAFDANLVFGDLGSSRSEGQSESRTPPRLAKSGLETVEHAG